jgi:hypothetical protein
MCSTGQLACCAASALQDATLLRKAVEVKLKEEELHRHQQQQASTDWGCSQECFGLCCGVHSSVILFAAPA